MSACNNYDIGRQIVLKTKYILLNSNVIISITAVESKIDTALVPIQTSFRYVCHTIGLHSGDFFQRYLFRVIPFISITVYYFMLNDKS